MTSPSHPKLRSALRRVDLFAPLSDAEIDRLAIVLHAELDAIASNRGDIIEFAKRGEIGPREAKPTLLEL